MSSVSVRARRIVAVDMASPVRVARWRVREGDPRPPPRRSRRAGCRGPSRGPRPDVARQHVERSARLDAEARALEEQRRLAPRVGALVVEATEAPAEPLGVCVTVRKVIREEPAAGTKNAVELRQRGALVV